VGIQDDVLMDRISSETFKEIIKDENPLNGVRRLMSLGEAIQSYPVLHAGLKTIIMKRYSENRLRYYPYILSVITNREKWSADCFYMGVKSEYKEEFDKWYEDFKNYVIDNEDLHEFWML